MQAPATVDAKVDELRKAEWEKKMLDWEASYKARWVKAESDLMGQMSYVVDWVREDLPIDDAGSTSIAQNINPPSFTHMSGQPAPPQSVLVFGDSYGYCKGIINHAPFSRVGVTKFVNKAYDSLTEQAITDLIEPGWDLILFGCGMDDTEVHSLPAVLQRQNVVTRLFLLITKEVLKHGSGAKCKRMAVITCDHFAEEREIHEECGIGLLAGSTLFGFVNSARQEMNIPIAYIDTEFALAEEIMPNLASEVFHKMAFGHNAVRILNRGRFILRQFASTPYQCMKLDQAFTLPTDGVIAITGGNGSLGLIFGQWLLDMATRQSAPCGYASLTIHFLSRSMKLSDNNLKLWKGIETKAAALGVAVEHRSVDFGKQEVVDTYIESLSPNLRGIIHSAGVLQDGMLGNQTWERFEQVFNSKHRPAMYIHDALERIENPRFEFLWVFSSGATYGNMGQTNYSASNGALDALARHRRAMGKPCISMQWGAWGEAGMAANMDPVLVAKMQASPMPMFSTKDGLRGLEEGLTTGLPVFATFAINPQVNKSMTNRYPGEMIMGQYFRKFLSGFIPIAPPPSECATNPSMHYCLWQRMNGPEGWAPGSERLTYCNYTAQYKTPFFDDEV
eukprot:NODE_1981_length_2318_cov_14.097216.p1 GENE.NODE_1981_length_2318_cov_14.097216~~NODE_1981_length_2318_cov_14.097216.p1  ORF type:complete len:619 (-),score=152.64 NODE_1981_length_2318_cov_14.097216:363-2219(-)